jgi:hypothetical protein
MFRGSEVQGSKVENSEPRTVNLERKRRTSMKIIHSTRKALILLIVGLLIPCMATAASLPTDPIGGKPPAGSKVSVADLDYQVKYQRAFEAVLWSMPAVAIYGFTRGAMNIGADNNTILAWSRPAAKGPSLSCAFMAAQKSFGINPGKCRMWNWLNKGG